MRQLGTDFYKKVRRQIKKVREPGEPPTPDALSIDAFVCDLCKGIVDRERLIQCALCGRWVCRRNCLSKKYLVCLSCSSVIKLCETSEAKRLREMGLLAWRDERALSNKFGEHEDIIDGGGEGDGSDGDDDKGKRMKKIRSKMPKKLLTGLTSRLKLRRKK